ncbi:MAG: Isochorismate synthase [Desulfotomaculum sp. 46_296]|nr:MAG: Isochorismate synthase [Desulfotomaculum sp. 46_296]HAU30988.1 isochorismate synthase [Desulfotomaculum sp.]
MEYQQKEIKLKNILSFWKYFNREERFVFFNPLNQDLIIGAKRLRSFVSGESYKNYPYVFSARTFFTTVKDEKWTGFGNETIAFKYYVVEKNGKQTLYYIEEIDEIEDQEIISCCHIYKSLTDDYEEWRELFAGIKKEISSQKVNKVVLSKEVIFECNTSICIESVLNNLLRRNENSFVFAYSKEGKIFLGATPEILVQKEKEQIISYALAGTILRDEKDERCDQNQKKALSNDPKNRYEHQLVLDSIAKVMKQYSSEVTVDETKILTLKNLHHLQTCIRAKENSSLLEWVERLHPTPALSGDPVQEALKIIARCEKHERGLYAAPIGIMNEAGDGIFVAGIRSALIQDNIVFAYTGCGIVDKSDCEDEYSEMNFKLRTIIESLQ